MNADENKNQAQKTGLPLLAFAILSYSFISIAIVYYNYWFFKTQFEFAVFISWWQQIFGSLGFFLFATVAKRVPVMQKAFPDNKINLNVALKLAPVSVTFVLFIAASNLCLKHSLVSTYLVARSCTLLFVLLLSYIILHKKETVWVVASCFIMAAGFCVNSLDPTTLSFLGLLNGVVSSIFQAFYNVNIKKYLHLVNDDSQMLLFYNMLLSSLLFLPATLAFEGLKPFKYVVDPTNNLPLMWAGIAMSGLLSTSMNMFQYLLIRLTNPVASNIVGLTKSLLQTVGGFVFFKDPMTVNSFAGITMSLSGSALYCVCKSKEYLTDKKLKQSMIPIANLSSVKTKV